MNKKGLDDIRQSAQCWADKFKSDLAPDDRAMPTTPLEAYARASWCAEMRVVELCTALLEDGPPSTEKAQNTMAAITTSLYHVQFDGQSYYVEARPPLPLPSRPGSATSRTNGATTTPAPNSPRAWRSSTTIR